MYSCKLRFYLVGESCDVFHWIREMAPLDRFSHIFSGSLEPDFSLAAEADVILAHLQGPRKLSDLAVLLRKKRKDAQLILLARREDTAGLNAYYPKLQDLWLLPMTAAETRLRFRRWQEDWKQAKDLWLSNQYLNVIIDSTPNLIWFKDREGLHQKVNLSFCQTVGKRRDQVEGRDHYYIWDVDPNDPASGDCMASDRVVMAAEMTYVAEETVKTGNEFRLMTTYKSPLYDLDGSVMGTAGLGIDITQEREYEREIISKNHMLETIFTTLECGVLCHDLDGSHVLQVNAAALRILGYDSQAELEADGFHMVAQSVLDEDKPVLRDAILSLKNEGDSTSISYRVRHRDGTLRHVIGNVKLINEDGKLFYQRFLLDWTAQTLHEKEEQRRQTELIQALGVDYSLVCFLDLDADRGTPLRVNVDLPEDLKDFSLEGDVRQYFLSFVHEEDRELFLRATSLEFCRAELAKKQLYHINFRLVLNGESRYYELKIVRAGSGDAAHGAVLGFRSVDEETREEMEKKHMLEDALQRANQASQAKSSFLSNMSHDIRTPMNAIVGFTTLALSHFDQQEQVRLYLSKIQASGNHLLSLINDVLDMSQIESGRMKLDETVCSLPDLLRNLDNIIQMDIHARRQRFQLTADVVHETVICDRLRLNQVLLNILSNATKYTGEGGSITARVRELPGAPEGSAAYEFLIQDTGIGMSPEFIAHIYEPFEREQNTTASGIQGTGLGMAITKTLIQMMDGDIQVRSQKGVGTEVRVSLTFRLPADGKAPAPSAGQDESGPDPEDVKQHMFHNLRVLLVEDNELNQEIALALLEDAGFQTETAQNGQEAVDLVKNAPPDHYQAILMDVQMPVMNGYEATRAIRALPGPRASIPILAMTANAFDEDRQRALDSGMNGHIPKPIDVKLLLDVLQAAIEHTVK